MGSDEKPNQPAKDGIDDKESSEQDAVSALADVRPVTFAFAWRPKTGALIYVRTLKLGRHYVPLPQEGRDTESPFVVPLGIFKPGEVLELEWALRAFNELSGIQAMYHVGDEHGTWRKVPGGDKVGLQAGVLWQASGKIRVA